MPVRRKVNGLVRTEVDPLAAFTWTMDGSGMDADAFDLPAYATATEAARAWERHRRTIWAQQMRFRIPTPAHYYDGLTMQGRDYVLRCWNHLPPFDADAALAELNEDRANLAAFRRTKGAGAIADYLDILAADLDMIEAAARDLATYPAGVFRPYPAHVISASTYGYPKQTQTSGGSNGNE